MHAQKFLLFSYKHNSLSKKIKNNHAGLGQNLLASIYFLSCQIDLHLRHAQAELETSASSALFPLQLVIGSILSSTRS